MRSAFAQSWKNIFWPLARQLQIKRIGAEIELTRPFQRSEFRDSDLFKNPITAPSLEHAAPGDVAKIDNAGYFVIEAEKQFIILQWLSFRNLHDQSLHQTDTWRKQRWKLAMSKSVACPPPCLPRRNQREGGPNHMRLTIGKKSEMGSCLSAFRQVR